MICTAVPTEAVDIVWEDVSLMLAKAVDTSKGKFHIQDLYEDLLEGKYNLWLIYCSLLVSCESLVVIYIIK